MQTTASSMWPRTASSNESATISRETREDFIPSVPMAIPSVTVIELNSRGVPPAARTPCFTFSARRRWLIEQGVTSVHVWQTATSGLSMSASVSPVAFHMERAPARDIPRLMTSLGSCMTRVSGGRKKVRSYATPWLLFKDKKTRAPFGGAGSGFLFSGTERAPPTRKQVGRFE